jgi:hypothetical protein
MAHHLALGFDDEAEAPAIAGEARDRADGEGAQIPQGIEPARPFAELLQALVAPAQVIALLPRGLLHGLALTRRARGHRLAVIERLGRHLARVIDAHEACGVTPLRFAERRVRHISGGIVPALGALLAAKSPQTAIQVDDDPIEKAQSPGGRRGHGLLVVWSRPHSSSGGGGRRQTAAPIDTPTGHGYDSPLFSRPQDPEPRRCPHSVPRAKP